MILYYIGHALLRLFVLAFSIFFFWGASRSVIDLTEVNNIYAVTRKALLIGFLIPMGIGTGIYGLGGYPLLRKLGFKRLGWEGSNSAPKSNKFELFFIFSAAVSCGLGMGLHHFLRGLPENGNLSELENMPTRILGLFFYFLIPIWMAFHWLRYGRACREGKTTPYVMSFRAKICVVVILSCMLLLPFVLPMVLDRLYN